MEAVIFVGLQASGKSSFYRARFVDTHMRLNLDMLKTRAREQRFLDACLSTRQRFVIDNTNPRVEDRARYVEAARTAKFKAVGYYFDCNLQDSLERNNARAGRARIPSEGILATHRVMVVPCLEEFDELWLVRSEIGGKFEVLKWRDD